jgi:hypothetical protein
VLDHALKHYPERLKNLGNNDETVQLRNHILKKDLEDNAKDADDVADYAAGVTPLTRGAFQRRKAILEPALTCYIMDLKKAKLHCAKNLAMPFLI